MIRYKLFSLLITAIVALVASAQSHGALTYTLRFVQPTFTVNSGQQVRMGVVIEEISDSPGTDTFQLMTTGLASADYRISRSGTGNSEIVGAKWGNGFLDDTGVFGSAASHSADAATIRNLAVTGVTGAMTSTDTAALSIGYIDVTAGATGSINEFQLAFADGSNNFVLQNSTVLDTQISNGGGFGSASFTAVPEPTSISVLAFLGAGLAMRRRKR